MNPLLFIEKRMAQAAYHAALAARDEAHHELERAAMRPLYQPLSPAWARAYAVRDAAEVRVDDAREHLRSVERATREAWVTVPYTHTGFECGAL